MDEKTGVQFTLRDATRINRAVVGYERSPIGRRPERGPNIPPQKIDFVVQPYVVTQTSEDASIGLGANTAISKHYGELVSRLDGVFLARPYDSTSVKFSQLGDEVYVFSRFIHGVLMTGQIFMMCDEIGEGPDAIYRKTTKGLTQIDIVGDVVSAPNGYRWFGRFHDNNGNETVGYNAELAYRPDIVSDTTNYNLVPDISGGSVNVCRVLAKNMTGQTLVDGQGITVDWTEYGFIISGYSCAVGS